jgi:hypothetical protein
MKEFDQIFYVRFNQDHNGRDHVHYKIHDLLRF